MTPEYLNELADLADPDKLWRHAGIDQEKFTPEQRQQLNTGVALRRQAAHVARLRALQGTGQSLLLTPLSPSGVRVQVVQTPASHSG